MPRSHLTRQGDGAVPHPDQPAHPALDGLPDAPHKPVTSLGHDHSKPLVRTITAGRFYAVENGLAVLEFDARADPVECVGRDRALHTDRVLPLNLAGRVHQGVGQFTVVGQ